MGASVDGVDLIKATNLISVRQIDDSAGTSVINFECTTINIHGNNNNGTVVSSDLTPFADCQLTSDTTSSKSSPSMIITTHATPQLQSVVSEAHRAIS
jgi:hypothetical protein